MRAPSRSLATAAALALGLLAVAPAAAVSGKGDPSGDGWVDPEDVLLVHAAVEGNLTLDPTQQAAADVAPVDPVSGDPVGDGIVDRVDLAVLAAGVVDGDLDGDGVSTGYEQRVLGLDPTRRYSVDPQVRDGDLDPDGDGLSNAGEEAAGTNPFLPDTDFDGMRDAFEVQYGFDPKDPSDGALDPDGDSLLNSEEDTFGSDPFDPDTDDDGLSDGAEVFSFPATSPTLADTDGDRLNDGFEVTYGFHPVFDAGETFIDSDGDGLVNLEEQASGTSPLLQDTDVDGVGDLAELQLGSDPLDPNDPAQSFDFDLDGLADVLDNCMRTANPDQADADGDGLGDACDRCAGADDAVADPDGDGLCGLADNCPRWPSTDLTDTDGDGTGDVCQCGDVNDDGIVDSFDWAYLAVYTDTDEVAQLAAPHKCDFDGDGICTLTDADVLYDHLFAGGPLPDVCADQGKMVEHVLGRIGYGGDAYERRVVHEIGLSRYIDEQLEPEILGDEELEAKLDAYRGGTFPVLDLTRQQLTQTYQIICGTCPDGPNRPNWDLAEAKLLRTIYTRRQLEAVLRDFWFNHFNVLGEGIPNYWTVVGYEQDVIGPRTLGSFEDLLSSVGQSDAMLNFLNQIQSWYDNSTPNLTDEQRRHFNENYARELMELHTMGPGTPADPHYTEEDVHNGTRILTGLGRFFGTYYDIQHDKAPPQKVITLDGRVNWLFFPPGQAGTPTANEPLLLFHLLAEHELTARFVTEKLIHRFVSEHPPQALIDAATARWLTDDAMVDPGDLREVMRTILQSQDFRNQAFVRDKVKRPLQFSASLVRALGKGSEGVSNTRTERETFDSFSASFHGLMGDLWSMGETLYHDPPPTGLPEDSESWSSAAGVLIRINQADRLADAVATPEASWGVSVDDSSAALVDQLVRALVPGGVADATRQGLVSLSDQLPSATQAERQDRIRKVAGALLSSPAFLLH